MVETQKVEGLTQRGGTDPVGLTLVIFSGVVVAGGLFGISTIVSADNTTLAGVIEKSEVVRNVGLFLLGVIGLPLAIWRSWIAKQQVDEAIALNCPPFRPDSRHKQKGSSTGLGIGLCLTSIDTLNC
jgi:hypothetical protein